MGKHGALRGCGGDPAPIDPQIASRRACLDSCGVQRRSSSQIRDEPGLYASVLGIDGSRRLASFHTGPGRRRGGSRHGECCGIFQHLRQRFGRIPTFAVLPAAIEQALASRIVDLLLNTGSGFGATAFFFFPANNIGYNGSRIVFPGNSTAGVTGFVGDYDGDGSIDLPSVENPYPYGPDGYSSVYADIWSGGFGGGNWRGACTDTARCSLRPVDPFLCYVCSPTGT